MNSRALLLLLLVAGAVCAHAQPVRKPIPRKKKVPARSVVRPVEPVKAAAEPVYGHYFVSALVNSANTVEYRGTVNIAGASVGMSARDHSSPAAGASGGYIYRRPWDLGWSALVSAELPRHSSGITGMAGNAAVHGTYSGDMSISLFTAGANANYSFGPDFYIFAGANYPMVLSTAETNGLSGLPGYQLGVGYAFSERWVGEFGYRVARFKGSVDSPPYHIDLSQASFPGIVLSLQYQF